MKTSKTPNKLSGWLKDRRFTFYDQRSLLFITLTSIAISVTSFGYFFNHNRQNLADYDAIARLNIARKMLDSITPGFGQLGGIWLPFPQVLELPFIWNDYLWHTGIAGALVSMTAFIGAAVLLYKLIHILTGNRSAAVLGWAIFVTNINMLWLQTMAMSESFFIFTIILILYYLTRYTQTKKCAIYY